jgi:hypothetical protein
VAQAPSLISLFVAPLNRAGIEYMVTGGLASIVYGQPRLTLDVDLVIRLPEAGIDRFAALWPSDRFYRPPLEVIEAERARPEHDHFNVIHAESAMRADIYLIGADPMQQWAIAHRVTRTIEGKAVRVAPIEYVIAYKLLYYKSGGSDRHLRDIVRMLEISGGAIDRAELDGWIERLNLGEAWSRALAANGRE